MKISISPFFPLGLSAVICLDRQGVWPFLLVASVLHELGHYSAILLCGCQPYQLQLRLFGATIAYGGSPPGLGGELFIFAAGPAANLLTAAVLALLPRPLHESGLLLAGVSCCLSTFNLLPLPGLDGWGILRCLRALLCNYLQN